MLSKANAGTILGGVYKVFVFPGNEFYNTIRRPDQPRASKKIGEVKVLDGTRTKRPWSLNQYNITSVFHLKMARSYVFLFGWP